MKFFRKLRRSFPLKGSISEESERNSSKSKAHTASGHRAHGGHFFSQLENQEKNFTSYLFVEPEKLTSSEITKATEQLFAAF